ncbi:uncharacterized protein LOC123868808 isoform X2 [Maniola jurtina]|uniref:uncharacterized protein LOC123868808 isoform X2 n=1 Tax=Maniola jurtina TaxID=191418 RepID=UPI001E687788|nr:uncharacterized protein LOC123868808 isoform X2 [Maniola jurtina]
MAVHQHYRLQGFHSLVSRRAACPVGRRASTQPAKLPRASRWTLRQDANWPIVRDITMNTGKVYKFVNGYTYGGPTKLRSSMRYRCTMGCGVYLYLSFDGDVIDPVPIHNHKPANLFLTSSGIYIRK